MENNKKAKLVEFIKSRKFIFILVFFSLLSIIFIIIETSQNKKTNIPTSPSTPSSTNGAVNINSREYKRPDPKQVYLLNRFNSLEGVIGYTWLDNRIVYATKDGVFDLWQNKQLIKSQISSISFSDNGFAIYLNQNNLYLVNLSDGSVRLLDTGSSNPKIDYDGTHVLYYKNSSILIYNISDNSSKVFEAKESEGAKSNWINNSRYFYLIDKNAKNVIIYDINFQKISEYKIDPNEDFLDISPDLKYLTTKLGGLLYIKDTSSDSKAVYQFTPSSEISAYWISGNQLLVSEKIMREIYDLYDQYLWIINSKDHSNTFVISSVAIPNKIDSDIEPTINNDKSAILIAENNGRLWIISLVTSKLPVYTESGVSFSKIDDSTREY